jgi:K+-sensing histidine kinase KdpD
MKTQTGELRWINWNFTFSKTDSLIYSIGRDVTLEKIAEEQAKLRTKQIQLAEQFTREASESKSTFMTKLSHTLRNSLTSIIGYLQLLGSKAYENEEEHDSFIDLSLENSEELYTIVSDMVDVALGESEGAFNKFVNIPLKEVVKEGQQKLIKEIPAKKSVSVELEGEQKDIIIITDHNLLAGALSEIYTALSEPDNKTRINISATEESYDNIVEIQIFTDGNPFVSDLIEVYKENINSLIEALKVDKNDVIMHLAIASSCFRMLNGSMTVNTFGRDEGNIVQVTLPLNKT